MKYDLILNQDGYYYIESSDGRGRRIDKIKEESEEAYKERAIKEYDKHIESILSDTIKRVNNTSTVIKTTHV